MHVYALAIRLEIKSLKTSFIEHIKLQGGIFINRALIGASWLLADLFESDQTVLEAAMISRIFAVFYE